MIHGPRRLLFLTSAGALLAPFLFSGCFLLLSLEDRPCPCSDGYQCCEGICIENGENCEPHEAIDGGSVADAGFVDDAGPNTDGGASVDSGLHADGGAPTDAGPLPDGGAGMDAGSGVDGGQEPVTDSGSVVDAGAISDGGQAQDAGAVSDGGDCPGVDLVLDPKNCGACGISCESGQCNYGICAPVQWLAGAGAVQGGSHLVLVGTQLYYSSEYQARVYRKDVTSDDGAEPILDKGSDLSGNPESPIAATSTHVAAVWNDSSGKDTISVLRHAEGSGLRDDIESNAINIFFTQAPIFSSNRMIWGDGEQLRFMSLGQTSNTNPTAVNHAGYVNGLLPGLNGAVYSLGLEPNQGLSLYRWDWSGSSYESNPVLSFPENQSLVTAQSATEEHLFWGTSDTENAIQLQIVSLASTETLWTLPSDVFPEPAGAGIFAITAIAANHESVFVAVEETSQFLILQHSLEPQMASTPSRIIYTAMNSFANIYSMALSDDHLYFVQKEGQQATASVNIWRMEIPPL